MSAVQTSLLIAEDDPSVRISLGQVFATLGYRGLAWGVKVNHLDVKSAALAQVSTRKAATDAKGPASAAPGEHGLSKGRRRIGSVSTTA